MERIDLSPELIFCLGELRMAPRTLNCSAKNCRACGKAAVKSNGSMLMVREVIAEGKEKIQAELSFK